MTLSISTGAPAATARLTARAFRAARRPVPVESVAVPVDVLDRVIDDLFSVGLALHVDTLRDGGPHRQCAEHVMEGLDQVIAQIRLAVLTGKRSRRPGPTAMVGRTDTAQPHPESDLATLSSVPNTELATIDLLDAAHNARRALIALNVK